MINTMYILNRTKFLKTGGVKVVEGVADSDLRKLQAKYHRNISTDMDDDTLSGSVSVIIDSFGNRQEGYSWGEVIPSTDEKTE